MPSVETFAEVLNDYLAQAGMSEKEFIHVTSVHPTTFAELRRGLDPCNSLILKRTVESLRLSRDWAARFYLALLAERDGEELLRSAGLVE
jgi:predicted transcriptional regulator